MKRRALRKKIRAAIRRKVGKRRVHEAVDRAVQPDRFTLDLGCGNSPTAASVTSRVGMDIVAGKGVDVIGDAHHLPFADGTFEQIVISEVTEHLHTPGQAAAEMARVLQPGGRLVLTMPFTYPVHEGPHDYQRFTCYGLQTLLEPRFEIESISELFTEWETIAVLVQRMASQSKMGWLRATAYHLLAKMLYRLGRRPLKRPFRNIARTTPGQFLTAGYLVVARKRS